MEWEETGQDVPMIFWMPPEPIHHNGDCVYLNIIINGLAMGDCMEEMFPLCKLKEQ